MTADPGDEQLVTLRAARVSDAHDITQLLRASYGTFFAGEYDDAMLAAALPAMTVASAALLISGTFFVAVTEDDRIVGTGGWAPRPPTGEETAEHVGHFRQFAVAPGYTGKGIGRQLAERCLASVREQGLTCVEALATPDSVGFFRGVGFEDVEETTLPIGRAELPVLRMQLKL